MKSRKKSAREEGLTLIEIVVVIVIIGVVMTLLTGGILEKGELAKAKLNQTQMKKLSQAISLYRLQYNALPSSIEELSGCPGNSGGGCQAVASAEDLKDVWGNRFVYSLENGGRTYKIKSFGADGADGGEGANGDQVITGP